MIGKDKVVFILGPTAVGKSAFAKRLAIAFDGELISADSVQVFKGLDIGSAKEKDIGVVQHGIDIVEASANFSVFEFVEYTKQKIKEISAKKHLPIVVGGTGLYIKALTQGFDFGGVDKDENLRKQLETLGKEKGNEYLFEMLCALDKDLAEKTDKNNPVRLVRAIEIAKHSGKKGTSEIEIDPLVVALSMPREKLYDRINRRVDIMLEKGLVEEVKGLKEKGLSKENQSMHAIGYKEILDYLDGETSFERAVELVKQHTRNYAKRQLTFIRGMGEKVVEIDVTEKDANAKLENLVKEFLK